MLINIYLFILLGIIATLNVKAAIEIPSKSKSKNTNVCEFRTSGTDFNIEFKGKHSPSTTFGSLFDYFFNTNNNDSYCVGEWIMNSTKEGENDYKLIYYGNIKNGIPHGVGENTMITHTYNVENDIQAKYFYSGSWKNGYKEGKGLQRMTFLDKKDNNKQISLTIQEGNFINNDIVSGNEFSYVIDSNDCSNYNGKFLDNRPHGYGKIHHNNGTIFEGEFYRGKIIKIDRVVNNQLYEFSCFGKN